MQSRGNADITKSCLSNIDIIGSKPIEVTSQEKQINSEYPNGFFSVAYIENAVTELIKTFVSGNGL